MHFQSCDKKPDHGIKLMFNEMNVITMSGHQTESFYLKSHKNDQNVF